jgi:hypothetical protein
MYITVKELMKMKNEIFRKKVFIHGMNGIAFKKYVYSYRNEFNKNFHFEERKDPLLDKWIRVNPSRKKSIINTATMNIERNFLERLSERSKEICPWCNSINKNENATY